MQLLLDNGADINAADLTGKSPFLVAVKHQWVRGLRLLLDNGADVNVADNEGATACCLITEQNLVPKNDMIELLVKHNAPVVSKDAAAWAPYDLANIREDEVVKLLLSLKIQSKPRY